MVKKDLFKKAISMVLTAVLGCALFSNVCSASVLRRGFIRQDSTTIVHLPSLKKANNQPNNTQQKNISSEDSDGEYLPDPQKEIEEQLNEDADLKDMAKKAVWE